MPQEEQYAYLKTRYQQSFALWLQIRHIYNLIKLEAKTALSGWKRRKEDNGEDEEDDDKEKGDDDEEECEKIASEIVSR